MFIRSIDLVHSKVHLRSDGIVEIDFADDIEMDLKESVEVVDAIGKLTGGKKVPVLNVAGKSTSVTSAARAYSASIPGLKYTLVDAFVVNNLAQKILGNFYISFNKPPVATRVFTDIDRAVEWLKAFPV